MARRISSQTARLLKLFLSAPDRPRFGREIIVETGMKSGSLYPMLHRLEAGGLLACRWEGIEEATEARRRPRAMYQLVNRGLAEALVDDWQEAQTTSAVRLRQRTAPT
jgi:PadR family transcriptional regulator PadR